MNIMGVPGVVQRLGLGFFTALACSIPGRETKILPARWSSTPQHSPPPQIIVTNSIDNIFVWEKMQ